MIALVNDNNYSNLNGNNYLVNTFTNCIIHTIAGQNGVGRVMTTQFSYNNSNMILTTSELLYGTSRFSR